MSTTHLNRAQHHVNDEFYTQYSDIANELQYYHTHLRDKVIYCNCDDPLTSNFSAYFRDHFADLGLRALISTCYRPTDLFDPRPALIQIVDAKGIHTGTLRGDGDFRSPECIELLRQADIIVTNPPFSLFREFVPLLTRYQKQYLIVGNSAAATYKCLFGHIRDGDVWSGVSRRGMIFRTSCGGRSVNAVWWTNMDHGHRQPPLQLTERYCPERYPKYDNCDAIHVERTRDIPADYDGVMGVPITFMDRYCPEQFAIVGVTMSWSRDQWQTKVYPKQTICRQRLARILHGPKGKTDILNTSPAFSIEDPSGLDTYYVVDGEYYRSEFNRLLIRRR